MRDITSIAAEARARAGKGTARATRLKGRVPGVIYGEKQTPELISIDTRELLKELHKGNFFSRLFNVEFEGKAERVLARDVQLDPVSDRPIHVDFQRVGKGSRVRIFIPVQFLEQDQSPGIKKGGVLNIVRHEVEFFCQPDTIPESISISLAGMDIGHSIHISAFELPDGIKPVIQDRDFTVATIAAPIKEDEKLVAAEAAAAAASAASAAAPAAGAKAADAKPAAKPAAKK